VPDTDPRPRVLLLTTPSPPPAQIAFFTNPKQTLTIAIAHVGSYLSRPIHCFQARNGHIACRPSIIGLSILPARAAMRAGEKAKNGKAGKHDQPCLCAAHGLPCMQRS
jgi:hypothetical protein